MKIEQKLKKIISKINLRDHKKTDSATVHYYIQITSRYGVKLFRRQRSCEECFFRQSAAYAMGFGPKAFFTGIKMVTFIMLLNMRSAGLVVKISPKSVAASTKWVGQHLIFIAITWALFVENLF